MQCPEFEGHLEEIHPQGSRQLGTMTRPLRRKEGFDVDLIALMNRSAWIFYSSEGGANALMNKLHAALGRYADQHGLKLHRWERCATLEYADGMCADIAPVIAFPHAAAMHGEHHGRIPDRSLRSFDPTNPKGFSRLFNDIAAIEPNFRRLAMDNVSNEELRKADITPLPSTDVFGKILCRLIQMMKLHRDTVFAPETVRHLRPSSILITTLAAYSYKLHAPAPHFSELDLLLDIIVQCLASLPRATPALGELSGWWTTRQRLATILPVRWTLSRSSKRLVSGTKNCTRMC